MKGEGAERLGWLRRRNLSEHEFMMICEKVVETDFAVDGGPDDGPPVGPLEVSLHDLVEFAVAEHHGLKLQAFRPQQINGLLIFIRKSRNNIVVFCESEASAVTGRTSECHCPI